MAIDRARFAQECIRQGIFFGVEPHYLLGVAQLRSGISDDSSNGQIGPFRLKQAEWDANSNDDEFDVHFTPTQISSPVRQCAVFALMTHHAFDAFVSKNSRNPTAKELYRQQRPEADTATFAADFQKALDDTAALVDPAADAVLDDPKSIPTITKADEPTSGPPQKLGPEPVVPEPGPVVPGAMLTLAMLRKHWPTAAAELIEGMANTADVLGKLGINSPLRVAHFMGQISEECGNGTEIVEKLNYSAPRMMEIFPNRFPTLESTVGFVNNEKAFGDKVYNGRMGNRAGTDDGFHFRGRGCLQLTGRDSYDAIGRSCRLVLVDNPDLATASNNVLLIAATEFVKLGCLADCDLDNVVQVSARINLGHPTNSPGKINGLKDRIAQLKIWKQEFDVA